MADNQTVAALVEKWREEANTLCAGYVADGTPADDVRPGWAAQLVTGAGRTE